MKTWVNGELVTADKLNTLERSIPASASYANGVLTIKNGTGETLFEVTI